GVAPAADVQVGAGVVDQDRGLETSLVADRLDEGWVVGEQRLGVRDRREAILIRPPVRFRGRDGPGHQRQGHHNGTGSLPFLRLPEFSRSRSSLYEPSLGFSFRSQTAIYPRERGRATIFPTSRLLTRT